MSSNDDTPQTEAATPVPLIDTPCVKLCMLHPDTGLCVGCARTGQEIAAWPRMTPEQRRAIMATLHERKPNPDGRRGGRSTRLKRPTRRAV